MSEIVDFALRFAASGFYVFPMYMTAKGPTKPYGWAGNDVKEDKCKPEQIFPATTNLDKIKAWPEDIAKAYSGAQLCAYGIVGKNCVIFDIDVKNGKPGMASFSNLKKKYGLGNATLMCMSKSGGYHMFYRKPEHLHEMKVKSLADLTLEGIEYTGVDIRGTSGMVVGPTSECSADEWISGNYSIIRGTPETSILPECPPSILFHMSQKGFTESEEGKVVQLDEDDIISQLRRGEIPEKLPDGNRNNGFFIFISALKNKGFTKHTAEQYAQKLIDVTENKETLADSVDVSAMLDRIYKIDGNNPFDIARDLIDHGLYRLTGQGKIKYIILEENPYIHSRQPHDLANMKQLLARFERRMTSGEKTRLVNPAEALDKSMPETHDVEALGFVPGGQKLYYTSYSRTRPMLNIWRDARADISSNEKDLDHAVWFQFKEIVRRIFGAEGTTEYQLGLDFAAWIIQKPGIKPIIVPFIQSYIRGVGKSLYLNVLQALSGYNALGEQQAMNVNIEQVGSRFFNPTNSSILILDEVQFASHRNMRQESAIFWRGFKPLVTAPIVSVEIKGGNTYQMPNLAAVIICANTGHNFPVEECDRRIWFIDNNPSALMPGVADDLFKITDPHTPRKVTAKIINTLKWYLNNHKIVLPLDRMRAPDNDIKSEIFDTGLNDIQAWFTEHFGNEDSLCNASPVVTKDMLLYLISLSPRFAGTKWLEQPESAFREMKRRGLIHSIRVPYSNTLSRQLINPPNIDLSGKPVEVSNNGKKITLYSTRNHGEMNALENIDIEAELRKNVDQIQNWKMQSLKVHQSNLANQ